MVSTSHKDVTVFVGKYSGLKAIVRITHNILLWCSLIEFIADIKLLLVERGCSMFVMVKCSFSLVSGPANRGLTAHPKNLPQP